MALPQSVDPSTLNLSGKPAIATAPTTTTSSGASNIQNPSAGPHRNCPCITAKPDTPPVPWSMKNLAG